MFTKQDIENILALISKTTISGAEATMVAVLQQKLTKMINEPVETKRTTPAKTKGK